MTVSYTHLDVYKRQEQGRLRQIDVALLHKRLHKAEEEGQKQRADMGTVYVGIRHNDDLPIAQLGNIEFLADAAAQRRDDRHQLFIAVHLSLIHI